LVVNLIISVFAALAAAAAAGIASAEQTQPQSFPFEGGTLAITETDESDKTLTFDGKELTRAYVLYHNKTVEVAGQQVALFDAGDGGNQCGTATVIVWKLENGEIQSATAGDDCGSPPPAITDQSIYFVPYLLPGASKIAQIWTPAGGLQVTGTLSFTPQPGTGWDDLDPAKLYNIVDAFDNEAVYEAATKLLGDAITDVATGLLVGGGTESTPSGVFYASGCVPHDCGGADAFMAVDPRGHKLYFAQRSENPEPSTWPAIKTWPADVRQAKEAVLGP
jgi:hypothetical protein